MNTIGTFMVYLAMNIPGTEQPTISLLMAFPTVKECRAILDKAPKEHAGKFACIRVDVRPESELDSI